METMSKVKIAILIGGAVGGLYFFLSRRKSAQRPMMNPVTKQANTPAPPPVEPQQSLMDMIPPAAPNPVSHR